MRKLFFVLILLACALTQALETRGLSFLNVNMSPQAISQANAGIASVSGQAMGVGYSPLALAGMSSKNMSLQYLELPQAFQSHLQGVQFSFPGANWNWSLGGKVLNVSDVNGRDGYGVSTGGYGVSAYSAEVGLASGFEKPIRWGLAMRYFDFSLERESVNGVAFDFGVGGQIFQSLGIAAQLRNWGVASKFAIENAELWSEIQAGLAWNYEINDHWNTKAYLDLFKREAQDKQVLSAVDIEYRKFISLRVGYPWMFEDAALSAGMGLNLSHFSLDYGYKGHKSLSGEHHFGLSIAFSEL